MLTAYVDESYKNDLAICVGGWVTYDSNWDALQDEWKARIDRESLAAQAHDLKPLQRYHAADCATFTGDFEGWTQDRQITLVKDLIEILVKFRPYGFVFGAKPSDICGLLPNLRTKPEEQKNRTYAILMRSCFMEIGKIVQHDLPGERMTVIHDSGGLLKPARQAFDQLMKDDDSPEREVFVSLAPMRWQDCVALQSADLLAYEGMKLTEGGLLGKETLRKSLQKIVDADLILAAGYLPSGSFEDLARELQDGAQAD